MQARRNKSIAGNVFKCICESVTSQQVLKNPEMLTRDVFVWKFTHTSTIRKLSDIMCDASGHGWLGVSCGVKAKFIHCVLRVKDCRYATYSEVLNLCVSGMLIALQSGLKQERERQWSSAQSKQSNKRQSNKLSLSFTVSVWKHPKSCFW